MTNTDIVQIIRDGIILLNNQDFLVKIFLTIFIILYIVFSIIVARQIFIMNTLVNQITFSPIFKTLSIINVAAAITLLLFVIILV